MPVCPNMNLSGSFFNHNIAYKGSWSEPAVLGVNDCCLSSSFFILTLSVCRTDMLHLVTNCGAICFRAGFVIQARRLTDLNWFAQVSQVKGILYAKHSRSYGRLKKNKKKIKKNTHAYARVQTSIGSAVASIHYYNSVAPFCPKIIFEVDGITCINEHKHKHTVAETGYWY